MGLPDMKYCKCGHDSKLHKKNPNSKWSEHTYCRKCPCTEYLNRDRPNKTSYIFMIAAISLGILLVTISTIVLIEANPEITQTGDTEITFTLNEIYGFLQLLFLISFIFFFFWFIVDPIIEVLSEKKRRKFPIDE